MFCAIQSKDVMLKISFGLIKRFQPEIHVETVEKIAQRFNNVSIHVIMRQNKRKLLAKNSLTKVKYKSNMD